MEPETRLAIIPFAGHVYVDIPADTTDDPGDIYNAAMDALDINPPPQGLAIPWADEWSFYPRLTQGNINWFDTANEAAFEDE